eukprot:16714-Chlamydomonas_euryale.AAC.2
MDNCKVRMCQKPAYPAPAPDTGALSTWSLSPEVWAALAEIGTSSALAGISRFPLTRQAQRTGKGRCQGWLGSPCATAVVAGEHARPLRAAAGR